MIREEKGCQIRDLFVAQINRQPYQVAENRNSSYRGKFDPNFVQGKRNLVRVSGVFELSEFELTE